MTIPVGGYSFEDVRASFGLGQHRRFSGTLSAQHGSFFSGERTSVGFSGGRLELTPQFSVEPSISFNRIDLPEGRFTTRLVRTRTTYTVTPLMFVSALLQYNSSNDSLSTKRPPTVGVPPRAASCLSSTMSSATRWRAAFPSSTTAALIIKINRLFRL